MKKAEMIGRTISQKSHKIYEIAYMKMICISINNASIKEYCDYSLH